MAKRFDPWNVLVCHKINKEEEDQEALRMIVEELSRNQIYVKKVTVKKNSSYYRHSYYRKRSKATKLQREIITKLKTNDE